MIVSRGPSHRALPRSSFVAGSPPLQLTLPVVQQRATTEPLQVDERLTFFSSVAFLTDLGFRRQCTCNVSVAVCAS